MVRQRDHAGAKADSFGPLGRCRDHQFWRGTGFPSRRVMFTEPQLVEPQTIKMGRKLEVALEHQGRMLTDGMVRCEEGAELQTGHRPTLEPSGSANRTTRPPHPPRTVDAHVRERRRRSQLPLCHV